MKRFADRLREARVAAGLTQEQLGFAVGVTKSSVSAWENDREYPAFKQLTLLRQALGCSLDFLVVGEAAGKTTARKDSDEVLAARNAEEQSLLVRFRSLPARRRSALLEMLKPD